MEEEGRAEGRAEEEGRAEITPLSGSLLLDQLLLELLLLLLSKDGWTRLRSASPAMPCTWLWTAAPRG